ncbi:MAG: TonB-dependent receptor [Ignavibacteriaceae bacterium]
MHFKGNFSFTFLFFFLLTIICYGQVNNTSTVSGYVYDKETGESLIGANAYISGSQLGNTTNTSGYFVISDIPVGKQKLIVSYIGYNSFEKELALNGKQQFLKIYLVPTAYKFGDVLVKGDSMKLADKLFAKPLSTIEMNARQVNQIPKVVEADLLRALQTMPGITSLSDFSSAIYVRGGTPDQNLYLVDGAEIYNPEHAFGIFSTFNTNAIKRVDVSKGGFGAEYGGKLSSVIDVTNLDGDRKKVEGNFNLSLIAANLTLQMPLGSFGSLSGSFRRTYIDQTYSKFIKNLPAYYFYDGNLKGFFQLGDRDNLTASYFGSKDNLDFQINNTSPQSPHVLYNWGNTIGSINWEHLFSDKIFSRFMISNSNYGSNFSFNQSQPIEETNTLTDYTAKGSVDYYINNKLNLKTGVEYKHLNLLYRYDWSSGLADINNNAEEINAYTSLLWKPDPVWDIEAGFRFNKFTSDKTFVDNEPRFSIKYRLSESSSLKFATGLYDQYLDSIQRLFISSIWVSADKNINSSSATHFIFGYEKQVSNFFVFEAETYLKNYKNLYIFNQNLNADIAPSYYETNGNPVYTSTKNLFTRGDGKSYGLELMLRKDIGAVTGWIAYSLSQTKYTFDGINQGNAFEPRQDRTSVLNFVLNGNVNDIFSGNWNGNEIKRSSNWVLGLSFIYTSGQPITVPSSAYFVNSLPAWDSYGTGSNDLPSYKLYPGAIDTYRLPAYIRMDVSITWVKDYGTWTLSPYLQIFNIGDRKNVWFISYSSNVTNGAIVQNVSTVNELPFLPSLGVTIKF